MEYDELHTELITKCINKTASETEKQELLNWINQDKENESYYFQIKDLYEATNWTKMQYEAKTPQNWEQLKSAIEKDSSISDKKPFKITQLLKYAAVLAAGVFLSTLFLRPDKTKTISPALENQIITGIGERTQVVLPDGTRVWVNSCSSVSYRYNYGTTSRDVYLKGEAYFEVRKNKELPFIVHASGIQVKALGTSFNVMAYDNDNELSTVLLEGSVNVEQVQTGNAKIIHPGEKVTYDKSSQKMNVEKVNAASYVAWSNGESRFEHLKMGEITKRLQRTYHVTFIIENEKIKNMHFTGSFRNYESLDQILKVISTNTNLHPTDIDV